MDNIIYTFFKIIFYFSKQKEEYINKFFRYKGIKIGKNCKIYSNILTGESYLITIGDNVTISNNVQFITHDNSIIKIAQQYTDTFGEIKIGENVFIGARTIILPGVKLNKNIIVGSGSVVTKSFLEENIIIAGNPAKKIRTINEEYRKKLSNFGLNINGLNNEKKKELIYCSKESFIKR